MEILKWLFDLSERYGTYLNIYKKIDNYENLLSYVCENGNLNQFKYLYNLSIKCGKEFDIFYKTDKNENLLMLDNCKQDLQFLKYIYNLSIALKKPLNIYQKNNHGKNLINMINNDFDVFIWLYNLSIELGQKFDIYQNLSQDPSYIENCFTNCFDEDISDDISDDNFKIASWIYDKSILDQINMRPSISQAFINLCNYGKFVIVKWIYNFNNNLLEKKDIICGFIFSCYTKSFDLVLWIYNLQKFDLDEEILSSCLSENIKNVNILKWLINKIISMDINIDIDVVYSKKYTSGKVKNIQL